MAKQQPPKGGVPPAPKVTEHPSTLYVTKTFGKGAPEGGDPEVIAVHRFLTEPAQVRVGMGITINLGNFESARVDVSVSVPVYREEINDAYEFAKQYVTDRLNTEVTEIKSSTKKKTSDFEY